MRRFELKGDRSGRSEYVSRDNALCGYVKFWYEFRRDSDNYRLLVDRRYRKLYRVSIIIVLYADLQFGRRLFHLYVLFTLLSLLVVCRLQLVNLWLHMCRDRVLSAS